MKSICYGILAWAVVSIACEICQQFSDILNEVNDELAQLDWYLFPTKIQRMLPVIIDNVQKDVSVESFGIVSLNREQLKKVS